MLQPSGRVLVVDDDVARLAAVSEALRAKGHEVHAFGGAAEACAALVGTGVDVIVATAAVADQLDEMRQTTRGAAWILRVDPRARPPQPGMFIASVPVDASPRAVAETVGVALMMRRPKKHVRPPVTPSASREPPPVSKRLPELPDRPPLFKPPPREPARQVHRSVRSEPSRTPTPREPLRPGVPTATFQSPPRATPRDGMHIPADLELPEESDDLETPTEAPVEVAPRRRVGVIARDAKIVRRLCEFFEESGLAARGFTSARTAVDVANGHCFDALVMEEQLDDLDASAFAARIALKLGERAPRMLVLARADSPIAEPAITKIVRVPATPAVILETLLSTLDAPAAAPAAPPAAAQPDDGDDDHHDDDTNASESAVSHG